MKDFRKTRDNENNVLKTCLYNKCKSYGYCDEAGGYCLPIISGNRCVTNEIECLSFKYRVHKNSKYRFSFYCTKNSEEQQSEM